MKSYIEKRSEWEEKKENEWIFKKSTKENGSKKKDTASRKGRTKKQKQK